jgi:uncharacterized protein (DUF1697 family)
MIYVALLRGINVGGNAKVEMAKLKETFISLNCRNVSTYINSGNVIFEDERSAQVLVPLIEAAITQSFNLSVRIVLRDLQNINKLCQEIPFDWTNDDTQKTDVLFLWPEVDSPTILEKIDSDPKLENVLYSDGALVWNIGREHVVRGAGIKLIKTDLYKKMTVRNINTVRKLNELMHKLA